MKKPLTHGEILGKIRWCEERVEQLTLGGTTFEHAVWFCAKERLEKEAREIRPTSTAVACMLDAAAGAIGAYLLAPQEQLKYIKSLTQAAIKLARDAANEKNAQMAAVG